MTCRIVPSLWSYVCVLNNEQLKLKRNAPFFKNSCFPKNNQEVPLVPSLYLTSRSFHNKTYLLRLGFPVHKAKFCITVVRGRNWPPCFRLIKTAVVAPLPKVQRHWHSCFIFAFPYVTFPVQDGSSISIHDVFILTKRMGKRTRNATMHPSFCFKNTV